MSGTRVKMFTQVFRLPFYNLVSAAIKLQFKQCCYAIKNVMGATRVKRFTQIFKLHIYNLVTAAIKLQFK